MPKSNSNTGLPARNPRTLGSAAAFAGCIGLPEPSIFCRGEGSLRDFCHVFNDRAEKWLENRSPECRAFARAEREARVC